MYPIKCIKYLNFPAIPQTVIDSIRFDDNDLTLAKSDVGYKSSIVSTEMLNVWGKKNISEDIFLNYQLITNNVCLHRDRATKSKLIYVIQSGGDNVLTSFYKDPEGTDLLFKTVIEPGRWCIFEADVYHTVSNMDPGKIRFAITGQIFRAGD